MLYVDTAMFGSQHGVRCVLDFFGADRVLFGTDTPFDAQAGSYFIPRTISDVEFAVENEDIKAAVFEDNAKRILGVESAVPRPTSQTG
jgi:uncharacterized protein